MRTPPLPSVYTGAAFFCKSMSFGQPLERKRDRPGGFRRKPDPQGAVVGRSLASQLSQVSNWRGPGHCAIGCVASLDTVGDPQRAPIGQNHHIAGRPRFPSEYPVPSDLLCGRTEKSKQYALAGVQFEVFGIAKLQIERFAKPKRAVCTHIKRFRKILDRKSTRLNSS